ncbi:DpnII family type II restriction endonuclease [Haloferula sp.]|uniref:DpnII family type II restriction endonuclease n=1 Tax=Haloferula sp. TaxID=2497595 RepID=UPI003C75067F
MKRSRQTFEEIAASLRVLEVDWMEDPHAGKVITMLKSLPVGRKITGNDVIKILETDFRAASTVLRLFLGMAKDEYDRDIPALFEGTGAGKVTKFKQDPKAFVAAFAKLDLLKKINAEVTRPLEWSDRLVGLFEGGWGSARKGQLRGRMLEDFVEDILLKIFSKDQIIPRCQFLGASGLSSEKADFAIPSAEDAHILIEVKAFNATGSKQTDVLGDIYRIVEQRRDDTAFILVTDGISWKARQNDLRKIIKLQNEGRIRKIYTMAMADQLEADLRSLAEGIV